MGRLGSVDTSLLYTKLGYGEPERPYAELRLVLTSAAEAAVPSYL